MYNIDCNSEHFKNGGRFEEPNGVYKVIGQIVLPSEKVTYIEQQIVLSKLKECNTKTYSYQFTGEEPLENIGLMNSIMSEDVIGKSYDLITNAPKELWWTNQEEPWKDEWQMFEKIFVNRLSTSDSENDEFLGRECITQEDYTKMPQELKEKITFVVDYKKSAMKTLEDVVVFINWAKKLGIQEIIFLDDEQEMLDYRLNLEKEVEKIKNSKRKQLQALKQGEYNPDLVKKTKIQLERPLMWQLKNELIKAGFNFKRAKVEQGEEFYSIVTLERNALKIVFKTHMVSSEKEIMFRFARVRRFIRKIEM